MTRKSVFHLFLLLWLGLLPSMSASDLPRKSRSLLVTAEMRANAVANVEKYPWAAQELAALKKRVEPYRKLSREELWSLLPSQGLPRAHWAEQNYQGCPHCGKAIYQLPTRKNRDYGIFGDPWIFDPFTTPWKIQCPQCKTSFPGNDFAAFYQSALDEQRLFRREKGNPDFLKPGSGDPVHALVDDSRGVELNGEKWFFAAHYAFLLWVEVVQVSHDFARLYTLTGDEEYACRAGLLLHRMADLYPEMDYAASWDLGMEASSGGSGKGRVIGRIWENFLAEDFIRAYDLVFDAISRDQSLADFLRTQPGSHAPASPAEVVAGIEERLIAEVPLSVQDDRIKGNQGMHQMSLALAAVVLDRGETSREWLDWLFEPEGGEIRKILDENLCREGLSPESGLGYASIPIRAFWKTAQLLQLTKSPDRYDLYRNFPKFRNGFTALAKGRLLDGVALAVGDSLRTMAYTSSTYPVEMLLDGYRAFGSQESSPELAREIWFTNRGTWEGIHGSIYDADPEAITRKLRNDTRGIDLEPPFESFLTSGYGMAALQAPSREYPRAVALNFGRMAWGHGHADRLGLHLFGFKTVLTPDLGYPTRTGTWPDAVGFSAHVVSHNTLMVDERNMNRSSSYSGKTKLFAEEGPIRVVDIDGGGEATLRGEGHTPQNRGSALPPFEGITTYRRCLVMVDIDEAQSYTLDLFWARGGSVHRLIQNGGGPEVTSHGLRLTSHAGTYAGENVPFGTFYDQKLTSRYSGTGFMYLDRVEKGNGETPFWVDWKIVPPGEKVKKRPHLRVHNLTPVDEVVIADGHPPKLLGNPETLRYLHRVRRGTALHSQFLTVLEPYSIAPFIQSIKVVKNEETQHGFVAIIAVELADGRTDTVVVTEERYAIATPGLTFNGRVGLSRARGGKVEAQYLIGGNELTRDGATLRADETGLHGKLASVAIGENQHTLLTLESDGPIPQSAVGRTIIFDNSERSDAAFKIVRVIGDSVVDLGPTPLFERFFDSKEPEQGGADLIQNGDRFSISMATRSQLP